MPENLPGARCSVNHPTGGSLAVESGQADSPRGTPQEVFQVFFKLGLTAFGGPIAHLGYFEREIPVWTAAVDSSVALIIALAAFGLLQFWKWSPWLARPFVGSGRFPFTTCIKIQKQHPNEVG
jgi:hypothetical protein